MLALVALASVLTFVPPVHAEGAAISPTHCVGLPCDLINRFCHCLGQSATPAPAPHSVVADCMGCDAIIAFCEKHFHTQCVESAGPQLPVNADGPAMQCAISLCQDVDRICGRWGAHCLA